MLMATVMQNQWSTSDDAMATREAIANHSIISESKSTPQAGVPVERQLEEPVLTAGLIDFHQCLVLTT
jgi:hypothetical protein